MAGYLLTLANQCELQGERREKKKISGAPLVLHREHALTHEKILQ